VLFINLKNSPQGSRYCTVLANGKIDFPLGGEDLVAAGQTVDAIAEMLASNITLFPNAQVEVKVREYGSHKITVSGMVGNAGDKNLQREAMPVYAIRSEAVVSPKATKAIIKRAPLLKLETYELHDAATDSVMIYPGNSIEFTSDVQASLEQVSLFIRP
jgi:protein involved in polysaccharide export with SLBB domain